MKKIFLGALTLAFSSSLFSQNVTILDLSSLEPLQEVVIHTKDSSIIQHSNSKGKFDVEAFKNVDSIYLYKSGYEPISATYKQLEADKFMILLTEEAHILDEVVFSASKFAEKKNDVPQQIQVLKAKDLQFMNQQTTADVLQSTGNVFVQKSQMGGGSPVIRGFEANKVLMVVDGVRMNNAIYRGGHLQNAITMDNNLLDKAEIISGPGSVVYGSDALGGVIHFYTKNPQLADSSQKVNMGAGAFVRHATTNQEFTQNINLNFGFKKLGFLTSFTHSDFGDMRQGERRNPFYEDFGKRKFYAQRINGKDSMMANSDPAIQKNTGYKQVDFMQKVLFKPNANQSHLLNFQYSTSSDIPRYDRLTEVNSAGVLKSAEWYYGPQKRLMGAYTLSLDKANKVYDHAKLILAYQDIEESRHNRNFGSTKLNHRVEKVKVLTLNLDFNKQIGKNEIRYGAEITHNKVNSTATQENINTGASVPLDTRYPGNGSTMQSLAAYITHTYEFSPKLILSDGLRYSHIQLNSKFDTTFFPFPFTEITQKSGALNGNLGLVYMPGRDWRFAVLGSTGFRAPNVDDLSKVFESTAGKVIVPNAELKPEYTYNAELSISKIVASTVKLEATGYYTWYKNVIATGTSKFNGKDSIMYDGALSQVITQMNKNNAYIYGLQAGITADISKKFTFASTINYTYGRVKTETVDVPLDHIAPVYGKTSLTMKIKKFRGEFFVMYNGWKRLKDYSNSGEDNLIYATANGMPAWYTLNLRTGYQFNKYLHLQVALENILDQNYRVFASGVSAAGRNLVLTLRGTF